MSNVSVLTFHSVLNHNENRPWSFLSTSEKAFEQTLKYLKKHKYETITLKEMYEWKRKGVSDNKKRVLLHFDDGFLDNYTVVYPLLKKYGFKATVFVSPEFVDKRRILREQKQDERHQFVKSDLKDDWGYMSWEELKKIDSEGIIDVQAHAMTHTWYFCDSQLIGIHKKGDSFYWLNWNEFPENKPYWLTKYTDSDVPYGFPIFRYAKSLSGKRFIPDDNVIKYCIEFYKNTPYDEHYVEKLKIALKENFGDKLGEFETEAEFRLRVYKELVESKKIIEERLGKKIEFLAWPGGAVSPVAYEVADEAGYLAYTKKGKAYNEINDALEDIYRVGGWSGIKIRSAPSIFVESLFLRMQLQRTKGEKVLINKFYAFVGRVYRKRHIRKSQNNGEEWK